MRQDTSSNLLPQAGRRLVALSHMTIEHISGLENFVANLALVALREFMLGLQVCFHVVSFAGSVGVWRGAQCADEFPLSRLDGVSLHKV